MTYTRLRDGSVITAEGEVVPTNTGPEAIMLVVEREAAKGQAKYWRERAEAIEAEIREQYQRDGAVAYEGIVLSVAHRVTAHVDSKALADYLYDNPVEVSDLLALVAASRGFDVKGLPEKVASAVEMMTDRTSTPYFVSAVARRALRLDPWEGTK